MLQVPLYLSNTNPKWEGKDEAEGKRSGYCSAPSCLALGQRSTDRPQQRCGAHSISFRSHRAQELLLGLGTPNCSVLGCTPLLLAPLDPGSCSWLTPEVSQCFFFLMLLLT